MRAMLPHTEGRVDRDGIGIHYEVYGEGEHTIVFVPTWSIIHSRSWKAQIPYFAEHFRVIAFDPRGNGKSDRPKTPDGHALWKNMEDVVAVMDATGTEKATLVGMSFSGQVAFAVASQWPERVEAVVTTGASLGLAIYEERFASWEDDIAEPEGWQKFNRHHWQRDYRDFLEYFFSTVFSEPHSTKQREDALEWGLDGDGEMLAMTIDGRGDAFVVDEAMFGKVVCPCLILVGDDDRITPPPQAPTKEPSWWLKNAMPTSVAM